MFKKIALTTVAAATAFTAMPSAAEARHRDGYYGSRYEQSYRGDRYGRYDNRDYRNYRSDYRYGRRCKGTTGAILGGAAGALAGRAIDKNGCRR